MKIRFEIAGEEPREYDSQLSFIPAPNDLLVLGKEKYIVNFITHHIAEPDEEFCKRNEYLRVAYTDMVVISCRRLKEEKPAN